MASERIVHIVEDDDAMRESLVVVLEDAGYGVHAYPDAEGFLRSGAAAAQPGCVVSDIRMPGIDGLTLLRGLRREGAAVPVVLITGHGDVPLAVTAMKEGAVDFLEKPFEAERLLAAIEAAFAVQAGNKNAAEDTQSARHRLEALTSRERDVLECLVAGDSNKEAAIKLGLSPRTVEFHRAHILDKTSTRGLPDLVRLWIAAY